MFIRGKNRNIKAQVTATIILCGLFLLQVPYSGSAFAEYKKDSSEIATKDDTIGKDKSNNTKDSSWQLILVNQDNPLPKKFTVDLIRLPENHRIDYRVAPYLQKMFEDAKKDGVDIKICSAFRTVDLQCDLYKKKVKFYINSGYSKAQAEKKAAAIVADAGTSEHHTGLAVDLFSSTYKTLDEGFSKTAAFAWLNKNAHKYGFILRYPKGKQKITGITYEPWHYRYVGEKAAQTIKKENLTLEEYLKNKKT